jgi:multidrug efflux system membrane fusion protein
MSLKVLKSLNPSYLWAGGILLVAVLWVGSGAVFGGNGAPKNPEPGVGEQTAERHMATVRVRAMRNEPHGAELVLRGRTEAELKVQIKAEMSGRVTGVPGAKGARVKAGDPICELDVGARQAQLDQARAQLKQAQLEYEAAVALEKKGHRSETQTAAALAAFEAAQANIRVMEEQLSYTVMRAPFDGVVDDRPVEIGDYMTPGAPCAYVVGAEPFLVVGNVAESQIANVSAGTTGTARLVTGETVEGKVTFLASAADPATRTFRLEMTVPNPDFALRDGVTADIRIASDTVPAMRLSPAVLSLDDAGRIGVKLVQDGVVRFVPVTVVGDSADGMWVAGLPDEASVITVGQEYVRDGETVTAVPEDAVKGETVAAESGPAVPAASAN